MSQSLANVLVHLIFSTKERQAFLSDRGIRDEMHCYLGGFSNNLDCPAICVGGTEDHVHILARLGRTIALAEWVKELKRASSLWIKPRGGEYDAFYWQNGYGVFSVSQSQSPTVERYIANQEEHHRKQTFQDEFRGFLKRHGIEFDERYVWE
jgi:REP element-mobilizing transposase RayT